MAKKFKKKVVNPYTIFNRVALFTVQEYLNRYKESAMLEEVHGKLRTAIGGYLIFHKFNKDQAKQVVKVTTSDEFKKICDHQISDIVFALEFIKLWVEDIPKQHRPHLGIADHRLVMGRGTFAIAMIMMKKQDESKHAEKRQIIDDSVITAKHVYAYLKKEFVQILKNP